MKRNIMLAAFCCLFWGGVFAQNSKFNSPSRKLQLAEFAIANLYVDNVDENKLVETAIVKMLEELDPHSTYSDPEEVKRLNEPLFRWDRHSVQYGDRYLVCYPARVGRSVGEGRNTGWRPDCGGE